MGADTGANVSNENTWGRVENLFAEALAMPESARDGWVRTKCASDAAARDQVLDLLAAHEKQGDFLQAPMLDFRGQAFGPYRAVEAIGRGGMSVVYRGERVDGDFQKQVAIKVILVQSHTAFQQSETQILAALEHNNIARLIDAGTTPLGFRYLLMEYVDGKPCTEFASTLPEVQKLRLFLQMCAGVQYAHRSLVVHRDLKPDNVLVTADGTVKLLDFGIAKILNPDSGADQTIGVQAYTPDYASPEQILGQRVTTPTDIYSLGVILCELVSARRPRSLTGLTVAEIVEKAQKVDVSDLPLQGDLAIIAGKALRRDPAERYESAGNLARDIERYLEGRPIEARQPSWPYLATKFIRRNRIAVAAATIAACGLIIATGVAIWQARLAASRFEQVRTLARAVMFDLHDSVKPLPGSLPARKVIVDRSLEYLEALARDTNASEDVQLDVARGFLRLSDIQGKDLGGASLGRSGEALTRALQAAEVAKRVALRNLKSIPARQVWVDALDYATTAYTIRGETDKGIVLAEQNLLLAEELHRLTPADLQNKDRLASAAKQLAFAYQEKRDFARAMPLFQRTLALRQQASEAAPDHLPHLQRLAEANQWLGNACATQKDYANAGRYAREALQIDERRYRTDPRNARANVASDAVLVALAERRAGRIEKAVSLLQRALAMRQEIAAEDPNSVIAALRVTSAKERLGDALREWGHSADAIRIGEDALQSARRIQQRDPANVMANREIVYGSLDLALAYNAANNKPRACAILAEVLRFAESPVKGLKPAVDKELAQVKMLKESCPR